MSLAPGTKLGPYEIVAPIGAGGMGEVYRARDSRLNRDVAIKVLPAAFSADAERLRRFEQEARALSALNHPNLLAIYDIGSQDGIEYLVSELLEGESLRERLSEGALPWRKVADYSVQMAKGPQRRTRRNCPPRPQARKYFRLHRWTRKDSRFRPREIGRKSRRKRCHNDERRHAARRRDGHHRLHVARASPRQTCRRAFRYFQLRRNSLRNGFGSPRVPSRFSGGNTQRDYQGRSARNSGIKPKFSAGGRTPDSPLYRKIAGGTLSLGQRFGICDRSTLGIHQHCGTRSNRRRLIQPARRAQWTRPIIAAVILLVGIAAGLLLSRIGKTEHSGTENSGSNN